MEQPAILTITRKGNIYRFRLDAANGTATRIESAVQGMLRGALNSAAVGKEYMTEVNGEMGERLRRAMQAASQQMEARALTEMRGQTAKLRVVNDAMETLGRLLFDMMLPGAIQEGLRQVEGALVLRTNTPDIPWEVLFDGGQKGGSYLCRSLNIGRQVEGVRSAVAEGGEEISVRMQQMRGEKEQMFGGRGQVPTDDKRGRGKGGRGEAGGLGVMFLVNPTGEQVRAEEEVAGLCTMLPESVSRIILYRQQANPLEMRLRMGAEVPQVVHYAGAMVASEGEVRLAGSARLDEGVAEQLFEVLPRRPLVFLSHYEGEGGQGGNGREMEVGVGGRTGGRAKAGSEGKDVASRPSQGRDELMERVAGKLIGAGAGAVVVMRWPVNMVRAREMVVHFYRELAEGVTVGESMRIARAKVARRHGDDLSSMAYVLYGDPMQRLAATATRSIERPLGGAMKGGNGEEEAGFFDDSPDKSGSYEKGMEGYVEGAGSGEQEGKASMQQGRTGGLDRRFLQEVLGIALMEARRMRKDYLGTPHLFIALTKLDGGCTQEALRSLNFSPKQVCDVIRLALGAGKASSETPILPTRRCKEILQTAERNALNGGGNVIDERSIAQAVLSEGDGVTYELLTKLGINPAQLIELIMASNARSLLELVPSMGTNPEAGAIELPAGVGQDVAGGRPQGSPLLERLGRDLTRQASMGQLVPLVGREREIRQLMQTLMLKDRNNPILIGDSGVGKTTIVGGLAQRIVDGRVPVELRGKRLIELSASTLVAGTKYRGEFEERLLKVLEEAEGSGDVILFIDEMHLLIGTGRAADGSIDAAGILKPALAGGRLRCIGATTPQEYRAIEKDAGMERRLRPVMIEEPSPEEALEILTGMRDLYEHHHHVTITKEALYAAVHLPVQYLPNLRLPDKACSVLDEACSQARIEGQEREEVEEQTVITAAMIAEVISNRTGIPVRAPGREERDRLLNLEAALKLRVVGQDEAVGRVAQAIQVARAGLKARHRPAGVFLFLGPTGVGKTELARALASEVFGSDEHLIRVDMSEYMEKHAVSRMVGAPPGYIGHDQEGQLTGKLRRRPHSVVLLDEVEKAHPEVFDLFLQVFDAGRLTDAQGHTVDAQHAIWIMTSNVGTDMLGRSMPSGFRASLKGTAEEMQRERLLERLRQTFRPEFLNRIDEVVIFHPLGQEQALAITRLQMNELAARLLEQGLTLHADDSVIELLCKAGFSETQGARPLRRTIEKLLTVPLSLRILLANIPEHGEIDVSAVDGNLEIDIRDGRQASLPPASSNAEENIEVDA